jgi:hypothetical protein
MAKDVQLTTDITFASARDLAAAIRAGRVSAAEVLDAHLAQIDVKHRPRRRRKAVNGKPASHVLETALKNGALNHTRREVDDAVGPALVEPDTNVIAAARDRELRSVAIPPRLRRGQTRFDLDPG